MACEGRAGGCSYIGQTPCNSIAVVWVLQPKRSIKGRIDSRTHRNKCKNILYRPTLACTRCSFTRRFFCTNQFYSLHTSLRLGTSLPAFIAHSIAQYIVSPRPPCITIYILQHWEWQYPVQAKLPMNVGFRRARVQAAENTIAAQATIGLPRPRGSG